MVTPSYLANYHVQPTELNKGWTNQYLTINCLFYSP